MSSLIWRRVGRFLPRTWLLSCCTSNIHPEGNLGACRPVITSQGEDADVDRVSAVPRHRYILRIIVQSHFLVRRAERNVSLTRWALTHAPYSSVMRGLEWTTMTTTSYRQIRVYHHYHLRKIGCRSGKIVTPHSVALWVSANLLAA